MIVAASVWLVVLAALLGYAVTHRPPTPPPDPLAATRVRITSVSLPVRDSLDFDVTLRATATSRVVVAGSSGGYSNLSLNVAPQPGTPVAPGHSLTLHARAAVCTCHSPRPPRGTPLQFLTLHNARGDRRAEVVPNQAQFSRIDRAMREACRS